MQVPLEYVTKCKLCGNKVDVTRHELSCSKMGGYRTKQHDITVKSMIPEFRPEYECSECMNIRSMIPLPAHNKNRFAPNQTRMNPKEKLKPGENDYGNYRPDLITKDG
jgi:hypothetical protein